MKRILALALGLFVAALAVADDAKKDAKAAVDPAKLLGEWTYDSGTKMGEAMPKEKLAGKVVISKDEIHLPAGDGGKFVMPYKLDAKKSPPTIDIEIKEGPVGAGSKAEGIISLDGDTVKLCYAPTEGGGKRPTKFESTKDNGAFLFVLKRAKK